MRDYGLVALYQKCLAPRLSGSALRVEPLVRVPVPRFAVQPSRREEGWTGTAWMDRFAISVDGAGNVDVDTGTVYAGPAIGTNTTGQEAEGPHCTTGAGGH